MSIPAMPEHPAMLETVPATVWQRIVRRLLAALLQSLVGLALSFVPLNWQLSDTVIIRWGAVLGILAVALLDLVFVAAAGRFLPEVILGIRQVRVDTGGVPGLRLVGKSLGMGAMTALSGGVALLIVVLATRDADGRYWHDRWSGLAVIDVRRGRDVTRRPVRRFELDHLFGPRHEALPSIIPVIPAGSVDPARSAPVSASGPDVTRVAPVPPRPSSMTAGSAALAITLQFDTGLVHLLTTPVLIGRRPRPQQGTPGAELITIDDPSLTASATHLAVTPGEVGVWVEDLGSTNGTEVVLANGRVSRLAPGVRTAVPIGAKIRFGDRLLRVEGGPR